MRHQITPKSEQFLNYKRRTRQKQRDATGKHDDRSQLALNRALSEGHHAACSLDTFAQLFVVRASLSSCVSNLRFAFSAAAWLISKDTTWEPAVFCSETRLIMPLCSMKPSASEIVRMLKWSTACSICVRLFVSEEQMNSK